MQSLQKSISEKKRVTGLTAAHSDGWRADVKWPLEATLAASSGRLVAIICFFFHYMQVISQESKKKVMNENEL